MSLIEVIILMLINLASFYIGARVGLAVSKNKDLTLNPIKALKEHKEQKEADLEERKYKTMMSNIDKYDGTGFGQEDIPN